MLDNLKKYKLILASNSPRRKELLGGLGLEYEVRTLKGIDESYPEGLNYTDIPLHIARAKADAYKTTMHEDELLITADTIVWAEGKVLGKPADADDARSMLMLLSGKTHQVVTGVCVTGIGMQRAFSTVTDVTFDTLTEEEINYYIEQFCPYDKAGAYGIQEWIGYVGVTSINGSYFNVMGLPVQRLYKELKQWV